MGGPVWTYYTAPTMGSSLHGVAMTTLAGTSDGQESHPGSNDLFLASKLDVGLLRRYPLAHVTYFTSLGKPLGAMGTFSVEALLGGNAHPRIWTPR
jgi:hypothetical protein